jgi:hypothetical protein
VFVAQTHKRFGGNKARALLEKYIYKDAGRKYIENILNSKKEDDSYRP